MSPRTRPITTARLPTKTSKLGNLGNLDLAQPTLGALASSLRHLSLRHFLESHNQGAQVGGVKLWPLEPLRFPAQKRGSKLQGAQ